MDDQYIIHIKVNRKFIIMNENNVLANCTWKYNNVQ